MTWETREERDALADNRERMWNGRTPLYESGEVPMSLPHCSQCEQAKSGLIVVNGVRMCAECVNRTLAEKTTRIRDLYLLVREWYDRALLATKDSDDTPDLRGRTEKVLGIKPASEKKSVGLCDSCAHTACCTHPPQVGFVNKCPGYLDKNVPPAEVQP